MYFSHKFFKRSANKGSKRSTFGKRTKYTGPNTSRSTGSKFGAFNSGSPRVDVKQKKKPVENRSKAAIARLVEENTKRNSGRPHSIMPRVVNEQVKGVLLAGTSGTTRPLGIFGIELLLALCVLDGILDHNNGGGPSSANFL